VWPKVAAPQPNTVRCNTSGVLAWNEIAGRIPSVDSGAPEVLGAIVSERKNFLA
jgi:hypothetical protein